MWGSRQRHPSESRSNGQQGRSCRAGRLRSGTSYGFLQGKNILVSYILHEKIWVTFHRRWQGSSGNNLQVFGPALNAGLLEPGKLSPCWDIWVDLRLRTVAHAWSPGEPKLGEQLSPGDQQQDATWKKNSEATMCLCMLLYYSFILLH